MEKGEEEMRDQRVYKIIVGENNIDIIDEDEVMEELLNKISTIEYQLEIITSCIQQGEANDYINIPADDIRFKP